ncbi:hypothetical protein ACFLYS_00105 [Chloroflexota bacterium]
MGKLPSKKASRIPESIVGIVWSVGTLIFFNFFNDYIAYYHDGIREPLITAEFGKWLWIHNPLLVLLLIRYFISITFEKYVFRESVLIFQSLLIIYKTMPSTMPSAITEAIIKGITPSILLNPAFLLLTFQSKNPLFQTVMASRTSSM